MKATKVTSRKSFTTQKVSTRWKVSGTPDEIAKLIEAKDASYAYQPKTANGPKDPWYLVTQATFLPNGTVCDVISFVNKHDNLQFKVDLDSVNSELLEVSAVSNLVEDAEAASMYKQNLVDNGTFSRAKLPSFNITPASTPSTTEAEASAEEDLAIDDKPSKTKK
jgi:hypothetical protein